ncbi:MAG: hypothetical protein ACI9OO_001379, partial [Bacteroidia bacterium]
MKQRANFGACNALLMQAYSNIAGVLNCVPIGAAEHCSIPLAPTNAKRAGDRWEHRGCPSLSYLSWASKKGNSPT